MTFARLVINGHPLSAIYQRAEAETLAERWRADEWSGVEVQEAPDPTTLPHGAYGHACTDAQEACWAAARLRGWSARYRGCTRARIVRERSWDAEPPNTDCPCVRCAQQVVP